MSPMRNYGTRDLYPELTDPAAAARMEAAHRKRNRLFPDDLDGEEWRDVVGSTGYQVSSMGRARSKYRKLTRCDGRTLNLQGRILEPTPATDGRLRVSVDGRTRYVHLLVLEAFRGTRPAGTVGRHLELPITDNRLTNLEWGTASAAAKLRAVKGRRDICSRNHRREDPNLTPNGACLACSRAHTTAYAAVNRPLLREIGKEALIQREADRHYLLIKPFDTRVPMNQDTTPRSRTTTEQRNHTEASGSLGGRAVA